MLKRIKYISRFARPLDREDIEEIGRQSAANNERHGITGVLLSGGGIFLQILEGPPEAVDEVFHSITADDRHQDVLLLTSQDDVETRLFPDWAMKRVILDTDATSHMESLTTMLNVAFEQRRLLDELLGALERAIWHEFAGRS